MRAIVALLLLSFPVFATEFIPTQSLVRFRPGTAARVKDDLHVRLGATLKYRGQRLAFDVIEAKPATVAALTSLCRRYVAETAVIDCTVDQPRIVRETPVPARPDDHRKGGPVAVVAKARYCEGLVDFHGQKAYQNGKLSPFWAQEIIGADIKDRLLKGKKLRKVATGAVDGNYDADDLKNIPLSAELRKHLIDSPTDYQRQTVETIDFSGSHPSTKTIPGPSHGSNVVHIFGGPAPVGVGRAGEFGLLVKANTMIGIAKGADLAMKRKIEVLNISMGMFKSETVWNRDEGDAEIEIMKQAMEKTIVVKAAGNDYPHPLTRGEKTLPYILVGSIDPTGMPTPYSQEGEAITVLAPSGRAMKGFDNGKIDDFNGTSAASPETAGVVTDLVSFLPGIKPLEMRKLLELSAQPTRNAARKPRLNGAGTLNAVLSIKAAMKLAAGWPANREKLSDAAVYDFKAEAKALLSKAMTLLEGTCDEQKEGFLLLREAFLTDPTNDDAREKIIDVYDSQRLTANAQFYRSFKQTDAELVTALERQFKGGTDEDRVLAVDASARYLGSAALPLLETAIKDENETVRRLTIHAASALGKPGAEFLARIAKTANEETRTRIANESLPLQKDGVPMLMAMLDDKSTDVKRIAYQKLFAIEGPKRELVTRALAEKNWRIPGTMLVQLAQSHPKESWVLDEAAKNPELRATAINVAALYGKAGLPHLIAALFDDKANLRGEAFTGLSALAKEFPTEVSKVADEAFDKLPAGTAGPLVYLILKLEPKGGPLTKRLLASTRKDLLTAVLVLEREQKALLGTPGVDLWKRLLDSEDADLARAAIEHASDWGAGAVPSLIARLPTLKADQVRRLQDWGLRDLGTGAATLVKAMLTLPDEKARTGGLQSLAQLEKVTADDIAPIVDIARKDKSAEVRRAAVALMAKLPAERATALLFEALKDPSSAVRSNVVFYASVMAPAKLKEVLTTAMNDESPEVREAVLGQVGKSKDPAMIDFLRRGIVDKSPKVTYWAALHLADRKDGPDILVALGPAALPGIESFFKEGGVEERRKVLQTVIDRIKAASKK